MELPATGLTIRRLGVQDAEAYRSLRLRGLREHPEAFTSSAEEEDGRPLAWSAERLAANTARPHDFFLGAFKDGVLRGAVGLQGRYRAKEQHNATVVGMYVAPELAGQGAGLALMVALVQQARVYLALAQIDLTVTAGNDRALHIYRRCGFTVFGVLDRAIKVQDQYHAKIHMVLRLR
jgi:ribosomal protein S18 acetylase RimI-like enzyme